MRTWTVEIRIIEHEHEDEGRTPAAVTSQRPPSDREVPQLGDEPATTRALAELAYKALDVADGDRGPFVHRSLRMLS
jgi:hypothetical protein